MYLKSLLITNGNKLIREIKFHYGLNLIIDESHNQITGNNVGKTTVLKLVDFCLGADKNNIYLDPETKRNVYKLVKDFLIEHKVLITLTLASSLDDENSEKIVIEKNFLSSKKDIIRKINGKQVLAEDFDTELCALIFPDHNENKPTFRQLISHNIRYKEESLNNTLKTLDKFTSDAEYETLYLFLFGCEFSRGNDKQEILSKLKQENTYKKRLEKSQTKTAYETALSLINDDISLLNERKRNFNLNENFESDLAKLNNIRYEINKLSSTIGKLNIRKELILEAESELKISKSNVDFKQLETIYNQAKHNINTIQKSFSDLVNFHNKMVDEKVKYITKELPSLKDLISQNFDSLKLLTTEEQNLIATISKGDCFEELEAIVGDLTELHRKKGEYESIIHQLTDVENNIKNYDDQLKHIEEDLFSETFEQIIKTQLNKFNKYFAAISNELYGEQYAIKYDIVTNKLGQKIYKFSSFNANMSSGKKQGEISCFDLAYTLFADEENMQCLHFLLNDKKELMDDKQLVKIADFAIRNKIQFVASMLKDKLPPEINKENYFILKLSQNNKLFKIEK